MSSITETSPSDWLVSYPGNFLVESYTSVKKQLVYSTTSADRQNFLNKNHIYIYIYIYIFSIIYPRCIKEVFSDATVFIADFGLFLHHINSDRNTSMTLEEPSCLLDYDVLRSCLYHSKKNFYNAGLRPFL